MTKKVEYYAIYNMVMETIRRLLLLLTFILLSNILCAQSVVRLDFRQGSTMLLKDYKQNALSLSSLELWVKERYESTHSADGYVRIVGYYSDSTAFSINHAATQAATLLSYVQNKAGITALRYTFHLVYGSQNNSVEIEYIDASMPQSQNQRIYFTESKVMSDIEKSIKRYPAAAYLNDANSQTDSLGAISQTETTKLDGMADEKVSVTIYYRWDKDNIDKTYLNNTEALTQIDSLLTNEDSEYIDSLVIVAYASPEGRPAYNQALSQRRANTIKQYILENYPKYKENQIATIARGENWEGFRRMAVADPNLPMKEQVLDIIDNSGIDDVQRQSMIARLDGGWLYKNYILPNYYAYLRLGASLFAIYTPGEPIEVDVEPIHVEITEPVSPVIDPITEPIIAIDTIHRYPIALRTNLLYDAVGALNIGVELPYGRNKHWSFIADAAYAYWRSPKNLYALQTLEYGIENRYWFGVSQKRKEQKMNWNQPLKGFYVGAYGKYWQRYDVQWIDGVQGDASWSVGLTAGYAIPLNRSLSFDLGIGAGWVSTSEYRHYHQPEYDANGKYHLMWQETGRWSGLSLTKVRVALVWLIQTSKTKERIIMP